MSHEPQRLLMLTADYPPDPWSGIGVAVARQARGLATLGHRVHVLVADRPASMIEHPCPGLTVQGLSRRRLPVDPSAFEWIHLHSLRLGPLALELKRRTGRPLALTVHGFPELELPSERPARWGSNLLRQLLQVCDRAIFLNASERRRGLAQEPTLAGRSLVLHHGIQAAPIRTTPIRTTPSQTRSLSTNGPIVFAGRFAASKGIDLATEIADRLAEDRRFLVFAGGHGDPLGEKAAERLRELPHVQLTGWLPRRALDKLFARASLVLVPSRYEPFGLVALEAMRLGTPVLAAATGGLRETIPEAGGVTLASRHPDDWASAAVRLLEDPSRWQRLSRGGRAHVQNHFAIDPWARRLTRDVYTREGSRR